MARFSFRDGITAEAQRGIELAAAALGAKVADVEGYYLAGGDWDAETPEQLADLIETCWREQAAADKADAESRPA